MMNELKMIENDLVPVYETDKGIKVVNGRELHQVLQSGQDFSTWVKKRLSECDAEENEDFDRFHRKMEANNATMIDYIIKLDIAKEMAMLERNEKGKQVRKYFIAVEEKYKQNALDVAQLSPELQMFNKIFQSVAQQQLEQKRQAEEISKQGEQIRQIEQTQTAIAETFTKVDDTESFQHWVNNCITKIAESPYFTNGSTRNMKYSLARSESYERLMRKRNCRLDDRVQRAKGRALEERPDIKKAELQKINKLYVIANDKDLRPAYELVIKEMMMCYCVKSA